MSESRDSSGTPPNQTALQVLVEWANGQQHWVRAVVAELLETRQPLSNDALEEIFEQSLVERGLADGTLRETPELAQPASGAELGESFRLRSLGAFENVNRIAGDQKVEFNPRMTVLFGENAAGKSGYVRVLKRVADVRSAEPVLPDVVATPARGTTSRAKIEYDLADKTHSLEWEGQSGVAPFTRLSIFDSRAVTLHVDDSLSYVYSPRDLDLYGLANEALQRLKDRWTTESDARRPVGNPFLSRFDRAASIYAELEALGPTSDLAKLEALATVPKEEQDGLEALRERVNALRPEGAATRLEVAKSDLAAGQGLLWAARLIERFDWDGRNEAAAALRAAEVRYRDATERAFAGEDLPGVLSAEWKEFIQAGDAYLESLQKPEYPEAEDRCLYCNQALGDAAVVLLRKYHDYCNNTLRQELDRARTSLETAVLSLVQLETASLRTTVEQKRAAVTPGADLPPLLALGIELLDSLETASSSFGGSSAFDSHALVELATKTAELAQPAVKAADEMISDLTKRAEERATAFRAAQAKLRELEARLTLRELMPAVRDHVEAAIWASKASTITNDRFPPLLRSLTEASKIASNDLLNGNFRDCFETERKALRAPEVKLEFPGRGAKPTRRKLLSRDQKLSDILSEGEQKVIALADFLAEASIRGGSAPLVFDDPVTSLDHRRLDYIADRLLELSRDHQVVVFTHNIWFATGLLGRFEKEPKGECSFYQVSESGSVTGYIHAASGPRWDTEKALRKRINAMLGDLRKVSGETQSALIESAYDVIRAWCEVVVEQELLAGVTQRYQAHIRMTVLPQIKIDRLQAAISVILPLFEKACRYMPGHSQPLETLGIRPTLDEAENDWKAAQEALEVYRAK